MMTFRGYKIVVIPDPLPVRRTLWERLTERPWEPMRRFKMQVHPMYSLVALGECYVINNMLYMSTATFNSFKTVMKHRDQT